MDIKRTIVYLGFFFFLAGGIFLGTNIDHHPAEIVFAKKGETKNILVKYKAKEEISVVEVKKSRATFTLKKLKEDPRVEYAEPDHTYHATVIPSDEYFDKQWYLKKIKAPQAWDLQHTSSDVTIAVIDSGIQLDHPDFENNIWRNPHEIPNNGIDDDNNGFIDDHRGWDFVDNDPDPSPDFQGEYSEAGIMHGTLVTGVAAAVGNNGSGIAGITWDTRIMPLKVLNDKGEGKTSQVIRALDYAVENGADIINLSFVGIDSSKALQESIERADRAGVAVVAASGNERTVPVCRFIPYAIGSGGTGCPFHRLGHHGSGKCTREEKKADPSEILL